MSGLTRDGTAEPVSRDHFSGANADREKFSFSVQLTTRAGLATLNPVDLLYPGGDLSSFSFCSLFLCPIGHERDWPPYKMCFFRIGNQYIH